MKNQNAKTLEEDNKTKHNNKYKPTLPLQATGHHMNSCKFINDKAKFI